MEVLCSDNNELHAMVRVALHIKSLSMAYIQCSLGNMLPRLPRGALRYCINEAFHIYSIQRENSSTRYIEADGIALSWVRGS